MQVLDSASPTACLDVALWLLAIDGLQKVVLYLTNLCYNFKTLQPYNLGQSRI